MIRNLIEGSKLIVMSDPNTNSFNIVFVFERLLSLVKYCS